VDRIWQRWRSVLLRVLPQRFASQVDTGLGQYLLLMGLSGPVRAALLLLSAVVAWWLVLAHKSRQVAREETLRQTEALMREIASHQETDLQLQQARRQAEAANQAKTRDITATTEAPRDSRFEASARGVVLIVDDVPDNLALLHDALDEPGYTLLVATNGESALQRARLAQPDIVFLDALMPGMDGFEVARRLKVDASTAPIPVVFMTGLTEAEHVLAAFAAGGVDEVTKPLRGREVLARLATHVKTARAQKQARNARGAFGQASLVASVDGTPRLWQTALARDILARAFPDVPERALLEVV
jgi:PleD family two-component response regulator